MKLLQALVISALLAVVSAGCLKSRLQVREDGEDGDSSKPVPAHVTPVQVQDSQAPQGSYLIDELKAEITRLTGRIEELERQRQTGAHAQEASQAQKEESQKLQARIIELEQAQARMLEVIQKLQETRAAAEAPEIFQAAKAQLDAGNLDAAIAGFTSYLNIPKAPQVEEATFHRAEAHFGLKQYKKAIVDYSRFPEAFNRSRRLPAALLKIGLSFESLGMKEDAKSFYQELIAKFPKSAEAKKARARLK